MPDKSSHPQPVVSIPISQILSNPAQPRKFLPKGSIEAMRDSLVAIGQQTPIKVRKLKPEESSKLGVSSDGPAYLLLGGHRRLEGAKLAGWTNLDGIVLESGPDQDDLAALLDNQWESMHWLDWYRAIVLLTGGDRMTQQKAAQILGISQKTVSRAIQLIKALNEAALDAIYTNGINESIIGEFSVFPVVELMDMPKLNEADRRELVHKTLLVILENRFTEPQSKELVAWVKAGKAPAGFLKAGKKAEAAGPRLDPNDPNYGLLKDIPDWTSVRSHKKWGYILGGKLDKFGAPYGIYCLLSGMMEYFQRVERERNPAAVPDNPYQAKLEELLEKGVREALVENERGKKNWEKVQKGNDGKEKKQPFERPAAPQGGHKKNAREVNQAQPGEPAEPAAGEAVGTKSDPVELPLNPDGSLKSPVSEDDMKRLENNVKDVLGQVTKNPAEVMKKLLGGLFNKP